MAGLRSICIGTKRPLRVAAYCRVSTDAESQEGSYEAQVGFFENAINDHPDWEFAGVYADYAKTGRQVKGREDFQRMIRHAEAGKFDYVISKSISRFSRNAADTMKYIQMLSKLGVGVYFLEQNVDTMQLNGIFVISALSAIADAESESISQNVKMSLDAMNERGTPNRKCAYGYDKKETGWVIDTAKSIRVKLGFLMAANGYSFTEIARKLNTYEKVDKTGREWNNAMVKRMLLNEAYIGDIMTNKTVTVMARDGKRQVKNDALADQFYIDRHHPPMVGKAVFRKVRDMIEAKELAGQENFNGVDAVRKLAMTDPLLADVRKLLPYAEGRWMKHLKKGMVG